MIPDNAEVPTLRAWSLLVSAQNRIFLPRTAYLYIKWQETGSTRPHVRLTASHSSRPEADRP